VFTPTSYLSKSQLSLATLDSPTRGSTQDIPVSLLLPYPHQCISVTGEQVPPGTLPYVRDMQVPPGTLTYVRDMQVPPGTLTYVRDMQKLVY